MGMGTEDAGIDDYGLDVKRPPQAHVFEHLGSSWRSILGGHRTFETVA